jgi:hypothetical protein
MLRLQRIHSRYAAVSLYPPEIERWKKNMQFHEHFFELRWFKA